MQTSLDLLADAAAHRTSPHTYNDPHDLSHSPSLSPSCSPSPECQPRPLKRPNPGVTVRGAHQLRPRKKAHTSRKGSRLCVKPKAEFKVRRKELMERACRIQSLENSPVNEQQLFVLRTVYDEITMYPTEPWLVLMAIVLHRSLRQVKNWFSNQRQKNGAGDVVCTQTDLGERLRLRTSAIELCDRWSDSFFEEIIMVVNYRTKRRLQWERAQAMNKFTTTHF
ncbi:hypothetical protein DFH07DRAFT_908368 [Mycena maculata]|uniref:Homeobox domain-containing protein n=1 Tax=Mycena maculata TaxID=230809 RepID=A0AAD7P199_9AGAR|nr:hypothetical protein DFH07DRAFT_908368 [Mycena maculata]